MNPTTMHRNALVALTILACLVAAARATVTVTVPSMVPLLPNTPGQTIPIHVTTDANDHTSAVVLRLGIGDQNGINLPKITNIDVLTGTIFETNNTPVIQQFTQNGSRASAGTTTIQAIPIVEIADSNLIGTVTIDTTGFTSGTWALRPRWVSPPLPPGTTSYSATSGQFPTPVMNLVDGSFYILPEPGALVLGAFAAVAFGAVAIRRRRRSR